MPAWAITAVLGLAYVIAAPASADLAAASYRSYLFGREGFALWDNAWYAGHHLPAYSVLAPALGWLLGPQLLAALSMTAAAALFGALINGHFPPAATRIAAWWFALGAAIALLSNRVPFDLGLALGLGALLLARRGRHAPALALAGMCALASPVAGVFLALAALAWALAGPRAGPAALAAAALAPIALLALLFPEGGSEPFAASSFYPALAGVLLLALLIPRSKRALRNGAFLYAALLLAAFVTTTAVGRNAERLAPLLAGPLAACLLLDGPRAARRARLLLLLALPLIYWQAYWPVEDLLSGASDPSVSAAYYAPLLGELRSLGALTSERPTRVEVVPTSNHWEARWLAPEVMIARGWERQLDRYRNGLFYDGSPLAPGRYRAWLLEQAVSYVALPDAPLDYSGASEARLLRAAESAGSGRAPAYLREVWRSAHWRLFAVSDPRPLTQPPSVLTQLAGDSFTLRAPGAGAYTVRLHFTPYWALAAGHGCVRRAPGDWTQLQARGAGSLHVVIDFSPARVFDHSPRCR
jgi:hypothetical protein